MSDRSGISDSNQCAYLLSATLPLPVDSQPVSIVESRPLIDISHSVIVNGASRASGSEVMMGKKKERKVRSDKGTKRGSRKRVTSAQQINIPST